MIGTLFRLDKDKMILEKDCYKIAPGLKDLSEDELRYLVLAYDYKSPFKNLPEKERQRKAKSSVWGDKDKGINKRTERCIELYRSLQFDPREERIRVYRKKIRSLEMQLEQEDKARSISEITKAIDHLGKKIEETVEDIHKNDELEAELEGKAKLSFLERIQKNKELYNMDKPDISGDDVDIEVAYPEDYEE